tara:strand:- start:1913 stop:2317 length:405 start_codon:yes stop_codon:yes gene_type:complete
MIKLPSERQGRTTKFLVANFKGYLTVNETVIEGVYRPIEIFITIAKEGSTISGLMDALAISMSIALRSGADVREFIDQFEHMQFEPQGLGDCGDPSTTGLVPLKSLVDVLAKILKRHYGTKDEPIIRRVDAEHD